MAVFDRPKTIALKWAKDGQVTEWNALFAGVALDLGLGIEVCWPSSPEQKGSIENLVGWVEGSFFKQRRFLDDPDLLTQLTEWRTEVNTQRPSRATGVIPAVRLEDERPRLRPLKVAPAQLALRVPIVVGPTAAVVHDTHPYSMPPDGIGIPGTLFLYRDRVRIVAGRFEAVHQRQLAPGAPSTLPEHRAQHVAAVSGKRAKRYLQREHLLARGAPALDYLTELTHRRPQIWIRDVDRLHGLLATYGDDAMRVAFKRLRDQASGLVVEVVLLAIAGDEIFNESHLQFIRLGSAIRQLAPRRAPTRRRDRLARLAAIEPLALDRPYETSADSAGSARRQAEEGV